MTMMTKAMNKPVPESVHSGSAVGRAIGTMSRSWHAVGTGETVGMLVGLVDDKTVGADNGSPVGKALLVGRQSGCWHQITGQATTLVRESARLSAPGPT